MHNNINRRHLPAVCVLSTLISVASAAERVQPSPEAIEAFEAGDYARSFALVSKELQTCDANDPQADECLILMFAASFSARKSGALEDAERLGRATLEIAIAAFGEQHPDTARGYNNIALTLNAQGRFADAEPLYRKALEIRQAVLGERHMHTATSFNNLAVNLKAQGRYADAEPLYRKALEIRQAVLGEQHPSTATSYNDIAVSLDAQGRHSEAEPLYRRALEIYLAHLGERHPDTATSYNNVAFNLNAQGRYAEAEPLFRKALEIDQAVLGERHHYTAVSYNNVAMNLNAQGRYDEAEPLLRRALDIRLEELGSRHPYTATSYNNVAFILNTQGRHAEAELLYRKALEIRLEELGERHPDTAANYNNLALNLSAQGRYDEAEPLLRRALDIRLEELGAPHPDTARTYSNLGSFLVDRGRASEAMLMARKAVSIVRQQRGSRNQTQSGQLSGDDELGQLRHVYAVLLKAAWLHVQEDSTSGGLPGDVVHTSDLTIDEFGDTPESLLDDSFTAVQDLAASGTEAAVTQMAARFAAGNDALARLARRHQDATRELAATNRLILAAWSNGNRDTAETLKGRSETLIEGLDALSDELRSKYPDYAELVLPQPMSVSESQASLGEGQGLLVIATWNSQTFVFGLTSESATWQQVDVSRVELARKMTRLRCDVDPATCSGEATDRTRAGASAYGESVSHGLRPFDRSTAYSIYRDVLLPVMDIYKDVDSLLVVASGPLSGIPLSVLVTEEPGAGEDDADPEVLRNTSWLGDRFALMSLPSVSSLESLGSVESTSDDDHELFVGVGDPLLGGEKVAATGRGGLDQYFRGVSEAGTALADPDSLRQLPPLPGTRDELEAMARALSVPEDSLLLGEHATETAIKASALSTEVLTFATHGLIAGELRGLGEPGLVLTPPEEATEHDDGILTASEVARLEMDVEWLILSACNTAAADGTPGAEGLSGLARAFLYAGARSLLVSHWRVRDDVTAQLTVAAIESADDRPRSESLQQAMRSIRTGTDENGDVIPGWDPSWSHPAAWAPFSLVGARP